VPWKIVASLVVFVIKPIGKQIANTPAKFDVVHFEFDALFAEEDPFLKKPH